jgi:hypothetical protein
VNSVATAPEQTTWTRRPSPATAAPGSEDAARLRLLPVIGTQAFDTRP